MRLLQAVRAARMLATIPGTAHTQGALPRSTTPGGSSLEISLDRRTLEETYMKTYKVSRPRLELQGSDALLKRQHRFITRGEIGFIQVKHLISALPEEGERPTKTSKRFTMDGWEGHEEEEVRSNPTTRRQLERMHMVFRTTLLMRTASGMNGSMERTLQVALPHRRRQSCSMQRGMHGGRSMTWSTVARPSVKPFAPSNWTFHFGPVKFMKGSTNRRSRPSKQRGRVRPRQPSDRQQHLGSLSG